MDDSERDRALKVSDAARRTRRGVAPRSDLPVSGVAPPRSTVPLSDPHRYRRVLAVWRVWREILRLRGRAAEDEVLRDVVVTNEEMAVREDPWRHVSPPARAPLPEGHPEAPVLAAWSNGRALYPPPIPPVLAGNGYDPHRDLALRRWCAAFALVAENIGLGEVLVQELSDPVAARFELPNLEEVLELEEMLLEAAADKVSERGQIKAGGEIRDEFGLNRLEARALVASSTAWARSLLASNVEDDRVIMRTRIEAFLKRAHENMDLRAEAQGLKMLAVVTGVTRAEPEDDQKTFVNVVAKVGLQEDRRLLGPPPDEEVVDADFETDTEEGDLDENGGSRD